VIARGFVSAADPLRESDFILDGQERGFADFLEIELKIAALSVGNRGFGSGAVVFLEKRRWGVHGSSVEGGSRRLRGGGICGGMRSAGGFFLRRHGRMIEGKIRAD
jgi:hypothetical protein